jgi:UDP-glucose 4-epimerase
MPRVGITGGAGFIGSNLSHRLISRGYEVVVIDDLSTGLISNVNVNDSVFHNISITEPRKLMKALENCETIFHLAARGSVPRSIKDPIATHEVNSTGTLNILEIARGSGSHVIFSSSSSVYGRNSLLPKDESMWLGPMTPYAASKLAAEGYVQAYSSSFNIPTTIFRLFNVFGPKQRPDHEYAAVLPKWIWLASQSKPIEVYGDGTVSRDFTDVDTVVDIFVAAMEKKVTYEGPINLAYGNRIFLIDVITLLRTHFPNLEVIFRDSRLGDVKESQNSPNLLKTLFPTIEPKKFKDALNETVDWLRESGLSTFNVAKELD